MKQLVTILIVVLFGYEPSADVGFCVKYEVEVFLKNKRKVRGFVFVAGYEKKLTLDGKEFLKYHATNGRRDSLEVYTNIQQLRFPVYHSNSQTNCLFRFDAATLESVKKVSRATISEVRVLKHMKCHECDNPEYHSNGIYPAVITELSAKEISMMQREPVSAISFGRGIDPDTEVFWIVSYSSAYTKEELEKTKEAYLAATSQLIKENKSPSEHYRKMKSELRKTGVIVFQIDTAL